MKRMKNLWEQWLQEDLNNEIFSIIWITIFHMKNYISFRGPYSFWRDRKIGGDRVCQKNFWLNSDTSWGKWYFIKCYLRKDHLIFGRLQKCTGVCPLWMTRTFSQPLFSNWNYVKCYLLAGNTNFGRLQKLDGGPFYRRNYTSYKYVILRKVLLPPGLPDLWEAPKIGLGLSIISK